MQIGNIQQNQPNFKGSIYKSFIIDKSRASALKTIHNDVSKMLRINRTIYILKKITVLKL